VPGSFASAATTANQHAVAATLDRAAPTATGAFGDFINVLSNSDAASVQADFDPLSGEAYGAFAQAGLQANRDFAAAVRGAAAQTSGRQSALTAFDAPRQSLALGGASGDPSIWMNTVGGFDRTDGVDGSHSVRTTAGGLAGGVDVSPAALWALGAAFGYQHADLSVGPEGSGSLATYQGALYGGYAGERLYVDAAAGYAQSNGSLQRSLAPAAGLGAAGQVRADQSFASGEAGVDLGRWNGAVTTPFVALDAVSYHQDALTETGAAGLGLAVDGRRTDSVRSELGLQVSSAQHASDTPFEASFRLGWGHEFADAARPVTAAFIGAPDLPFTVQGAPQARDFAVVGVGVGARLHSGVTFSARYDANLSSRTSEQLLSLNARFAW
jgi:outer membrane autotransporter protein